MIEKKITFTSNKKIEKGKLGRTIKISPKSEVSIIDGGMQIDYVAPHVSLAIGIGNDYTAELIMSNEAWVALQNKDNEIHIDTIQELKRNLK